MPPKEEEKKDKKKAQPAQVGMWQKPKPIDKTAENSRKSKAHKEAVAKLATEPDTPPLASELKPQATEAPEPDPPAVEADNSIQGDENETSILGAIGIAAAAAAAFVRGVFSKK